MGAIPHVPALLPRIHPRFRAPPLDYSSSPALPGTRFPMNLRSSHRSTTECFRHSMQHCLRIAELEGIPAISKGSNFVFSPLSFTAALSLTASGANGETLTELLSFLGSPNIDHLHSASVNLAQVARAGKGDLILSFFNGAWIDRSMTVHPAFAAVAASVHGAAVEPVDFIHQASVEEKKINNWIEEKTYGIIKNLIPDGTINSLTRLILANALYFKGIWQDKFDEFMTKMDKFYLLNGSIVEASFMSSREDQFISSHDGFKVLKLPYKKEGDGQDSRSFSMLLFLPNERNGLHDLITRIVTTPNFVQEHVPHVMVKVGKFMVPKFKTSFKFEATKVLTQLELRRVFSCLSADLSGMCLVSTRDENLFVSTILHEAAIEVDEEGTTAAAATVVVLEGSSWKCYTPTMNFVADHPFIFVVREDRTGAILFFGHIVNPLV